MNSIKIQHLLGYFENFWPIENLTTEMLNQCVLEKKLKKKEKILVEGENCNFLTFVVKGILKTYHIDKKGNQHNLQFTSENKWVTDFSSLYNSLPSKLNIEALEASIILQIKKEDLFNLYDNSPMFDRNMRIITENAFIEQQERVLQHISSTAHERYLYFLNKYPNLSNRISNIQIASYIGVTPEFLSAIRKKTTI
ncbi:Crp/Fnr family transcriptional regulator [Rasiella rasia]|uniref:Crp/Fnr family transcriptional regulator n=1 Tax=Rasiella rasia TaxID=2744027 RepID=A0A6G6GHJ4_9FLAO|nr:Crp/Fnr family transcriptional regulator [Rasiella rasia]QIE58045.1 Crp/Fnr family transcriptional regulator [Rasiella rasia]